MFRTWECRPYGTHLQTDDAKPQLRGRIDRPRFHLSVDHYFRPRLARIWIPPRIAGLCRQIRRLDAMGGDGFLSGRDGRLCPVTAEPRASFGADRYRRGAIPACPCPMAGRLSADDRGRAVAWQGVLAMEHARLRRWNRAGDVARSLRGAGSQGALADGSWQIAPHCWSDAACRSVPKNGGGLHGLRAGHDFLKTSAVVPREKRGPIATDGSFAKSVCQDAPNEGRGVWAPAFAGATERVTSPAP